MTTADLAVFALALALAAGTPGPTIAALVARVLSSGWRDVLPFAAALWVGEALWLLAALLGLAALAQVFQGTFAVIRWIGIAYLIYLAWKTWTAPVTDAATLPRRASPWAMFGAGMAVTLGNPKIMVFYLALLPSLFDLTRIGVADGAAMLAVCMGVLAVIDGGWMLAAERTRVLLRTPSAKRMANRVSACALGGAAGLIASRSA